MRNGVTPTAVCEYPIFSDAAVGDAWNAAECPYTFVPVGREVPIIRRTPAVIARVAYHSGKGLGLKPPPFHAGDLQDELAALLALSLGGRAKTTRTYTRIFSPSDDSLGRPIHNEEPILVPEVPMFSGEMLPRSVGARRLSEHLTLFGELPNISRSDAGILVAAARLYQEAVWIANVDPERAWLLLVSAVETAAGYAYARESSQLERMRASRPDLESILVEAGGSQLAQKVVELIADYMGATKKFRDFLLAYLPAPPANREKEMYRIPWDKKYLKNAFEKIYGYRSRTLHGGIAFPPPLCQAPGGVEERPAYQSASSRGILG